MLDSEAPADDDDASDELPEPVPLEPVLELEDDDTSAAGVDADPTPKLDSAGAVGLQGVSARRAVRRTGVLYHGALKRAREPSAPHAPQPIRDLVEFKSAQERRSAIALHRNTAGFLRKPRC